MRFLFYFPLTIIFLALPLIAASAEETPQLPEKWIIVLDPGHGGDDDGAVGHHFREKNIVLNFTMRLREQIQHLRPNYEIYLTRERDEAVPLHARIAMARRLQADLFLSIHADSSPNPKVRGFSAYSAESGAVPRYNPDKPDNYLQSGLLQDENPDAVNLILYDLISRENRRQSGFVAQTMLEAARQQTPLLERAHRLARFHVLTAPDIPAVLLELGFLTNQQDANNLARPHWQVQMAHRLAGAIDAALMKIHRAKQQSVDLSSLN